MAVTASSVGTGDTLETFRQEFNNAVVDLGNLDSATVSSISIAANNSTDESAFLIFVDGATGQQALESDTALTYNPSSNLLTLGSLVIADAGNIGSASDTNAIGISSGGVVSITATTANSSTTDGALTVAGGLGVAGNTSIGGTLTVTGTTTLNGALNLGDAAGDALAINATTTVNENMTFTDNDKALFGTGADMELYHDASNSYIANKTGALKIATETSGIAITLGHSTSEVTVADNLTVTGNLTVSGTSTIVDTVTMNAANALIFEGATADAHETTLSIVDPTADRTINLPNVSGTLPVLAAVSTTQVSSTPEELNILDGATVVVGEINALDLGSTAVGTAIASKAVILDSNKDYTGIRNFTITGEIDAATGDFSGAVDVAGATTTAALTASGILKTDDTTEATSTTDGSLQTDGGLSVAKDIVAGDDIKLLSDASVIAFGANGDVTLTHVHDTGILLNSTMAIQFNDASQSINAPSNAILDINATDEIELNATLLDVNANINASGTYTGAGLMTTGGNIVIPDAGTIGAASSTSAITIASTGIVTFVDDIVIKDGGTIGVASDADSITIASNGQLTLTQTLIGTALDISGDIDVDGTTNLDVVDIDGAVDMASTLGVTGVVTANAGVVVDNITIDGTEIDLSSGDLTVDVAGDIILDADGGDVFFKDAGTTFGSATNTSGNLIIKSGTTTAATFSGANVTFAGTIGSGNITSTGTLQGTTITATTAVVPDASDGAALGTTALEWSDLFIADGGIIYFGDDQEITLTHVADVGLNLKHTATADDKPIILTLQTGETDMQANDVLGEIRWQAPDEGTGTDAVAIAASIVAISEGNFAADNNATKMEFRLGSSEAATQKATLASNGNFQVDGTLTCDPLATLLIKDSSGSTLKTINGVTSN